MPSEIAVQDAESQKEGLVVKPKQQHSLGTVVIGAALMGFCFGFLFEKSHVYEPSSIRLQFDFEKWIMLKMFMGAVAGSSFMFVSLSATAPETFEQVREAFPPSSRGWLTGGLLGGCMLGAGMVVGGACPGMVLAQLGTALPNSWLTLIGGLLGALVYGLMEPVLKPHVLEKGPQCETRGPRIYADKFLNVRYALLAAPFGVVCAGIAVLLEVLVDYRKELGIPSQTASNPFILYAWPPSLCGFLLGCLQMPCALLIGDSLGSTTGYQCLVSQCLAAAPSAASRFTYMSNHRFGRGNWWQVVYISCAVLGALASAALADNLPTVANGVDVASSLIGGFLMVFGSRMGGGCTSGHGISGMPLLHGLSIVGVCGMFGFGIVLAFIMKAANVLAV